MRFILGFILLVFCCGCAQKALDYEPREPKDANLSANFIIDEHYYKLYDIALLNELIATALLNNHDIKTALINLKKALISADMAAIELYPTPSAQYKIMGQKNINQANSQTSYKSGINLSWTLDLFGRIGDEKEAAFWEARASKYDHLSVKNLITNSIIKVFFEISYQNDALKLLEQNIKNYQKLLDITMVKFQNGKIEKLAYDEAYSSFLNLVNQKIVLNLKQAKSHLFLKNLLALNDDKYPQNSLSSASLEDAKFLGVDFSIPLFALSNRVDLLFHISKINSAFYRYSASLKDFFPDITIGATLSNSLTSSARDGFNMDFLNGVININMGFLDYGRLKNRADFNEENFNLAANEYKKALNVALNELDFYNKQYQISLQKLQNSRLILENEAQITRSYRLKFEYGKAQMREFLDAQNKEISAKNAFIEARYNAIINEVLIHEAMGGVAKFTH